MTTYALEEIDSLTFAEQRAGQFTIGMVGLSGLQWSSIGETNGQTLGECIASQVTEIERLVSNQHGQGQ